MGTSRNEPGNAPVSSPRLRAVRPGEPLETAPIGEAKVARLREAIANGTLQLDADRIAERILGEVEEAPHPAVRGACYPAPPCPSPRTFSSSAAGSRA